MFENGAYRTDTPLAVGDVLKIGVATVSGVAVVKYYKNNVEIRTSDLPVAYPVEARFHSGWNSPPGTGLTGAWVDGFTTVETVSWQNTVNVTTGADGAITKNAGGYWHASAESLHMFTGDGYFECRVNNVGTPGVYPMDAGLTAADTPGVNYYWAISSGYAQPYVNNSYRASTPVTTGDRLRIAIEGGVVKFYKNAELVYTSDVVTAYPLRSYWGSAIDGAGLTSAYVGW